MTWVRPPATRRWMSRASTATSSPARWATSRARPTRSSSWRSGPSVRPTRSLRPPSAIVAGACRPLSSEPEVHLHARTPSTRSRQSRLHRVPQRRRTRRRTRRREKPQADADPAFCDTCHTGDIAPILFGPITPAGREHPGAPKIDVERVAQHPLAHGATGRRSSTGCRTTRSSRRPALACHKDPTQATGLQVLPFARVPEFRVSTAAQRASGLPMAIFSVARGALAADGGPAKRRRSTALHARGG